MKTAYNRILFIIIITLSLKQLAYLYMGGDIITYLNSKGVCISTSSTIEFLRSIFSHAHAFYQTLNNFPTYCVSLMKVLQYTIQDN